MGVAGTNKDELMRALRGINPEIGDAATRLISWHHLAEAGLAAASGSGRYLQFSLTEAGRAAQKEIDT
jgi:hypothetical protein